LSVCTVTRVQETEIICGIQIWSGCLAEAKIQRSIQVWQTIVDVKFSRRESGSVLQAAIPRTPLLSEGVREIVSE